MRISFFSPSSTALHFSAQQCFIAERPSLFQPSKGLIALAYCLYCPLNIPRNPLMRNPAATNSGIRLIKATTLSPSISVFRALYTCVQTTNPIRVNSEPTIMSMTPAIFYLLFSKQHGRSNGYNRGLLANFDRPEVINGKKEETLVRSHLQSLNNMFVLYA